MEKFLELIMPYVFEFVMAIISIVVARYVVPYIKNELIPWLKERRSYNIVKSFVQAVEKLAETGAIAKVDKKQKVVELLNNKGIAVDATIDAFIESCVKELDIVASVVYDEIVNDE